VATTRTLHHEPRARRWNTRSRQSTGDQGFLGASCRSIGASCFYCGVPPSTRDELDRAEAKPALRSKHPSLTRERFIGPATTRWQEARSRSDSPQSHRHMPAPPWAAISAAKSAEMAGDRPGFLSTPSTSGPGKRCREGRAATPARGPVAPTSPRPPRPIDQNAAYRFAIVHWGSGLAGSGPAGRGRRRGRWRNKPLSVRCNEASERAFADCEENRDAGDEGRNAVE